MEYNLKKIADILQTSKIIAVVGLSPKPDRPSNEVATYLIENNFEVIPVNPAYEKILGKNCYPSLFEIPAPVDIVDIFRRSEDVLPIIQQTIQIKATYAWMQEDIRNEKAAQLGETHGVTVIQDLCIKKMHQKCKADGLI